MSAPGPPVRIGLVGVGSIGRRHLRLAEDEPLCRVVALCDPEPAVASLGEARGIPFHRSHQRMLETEALDGVIVAAPTPQHAPIGLDVVGAGLPVLVEKPFTDTLEAGRSLATAAAATGVPVCVGHHRRFDPAVVAARRVLRDLEIGSLVGVSGLWATRKPDAYFEVAWRRQPGGGPVLINMIHDIDMLRSCCGEVEHVYAETTCRERGLPVEDGGAILLRFRGGVLATISFTDSTPSPWGWERSTGDNPAIPAAGENCYRFLGTEGSFEFPRIRVWRTDPGQEPSWSCRITARDRPLAPRAALAAQLVNFCRVIQGRETPVVGAGDGLATLAVALAVLESARTGRRVRPAPTGAAENRPGP